MRKGLDATYLGLMFAGMLWFLIIAFGMGTHYRALSAQLDAICAAVECETSP